MKFRLLIILNTILWIFVAIEFPKAQCNPMGEVVCEDAFVLCHVNELNGLSCSNSSNQPSGCNPLCTNGGVPENTSWWAFIATEGNTRITVNVTSCLNGQGLQFGLNGNCGCSEPIVCHSTPCASSGSYTINASLAPCKVYYLWVDGCNADVCNFTFTTSGEIFDPSPRYINNDADRIIEVCKGYTEHPFFINSGEACINHYIWELDGVVLMDDYFRISLHFPNEGDFQLCVTSQYRTPQNTICNNIGPNCSTVKVRGLPERRGNSRNLCPEDTPFQWHCQTITESGEYKCELENQNNCTFDSIVYFNVFEGGEPIEINYIPCDKQWFVDSKGRVYVGCKNQQQFIIENSTKDGCDVNYSLSSVYPDFELKFDLQCEPNGIVINTIIENKTQSCGAGESFDYDSYWYIKEDSLRTPIQNGGALHVEYKDSTYCYVLRVTTNLRNTSKTCEYIHCEQFKESNYKPTNIVINGPAKVCPGIGTKLSYQVNIFAGNIQSYTWHIDSPSFGKIITLQPSTLVEVEWNLAPGQSGKLCFNYQDDCNVLNQQCFTVKAAKAYAGVDDEITILIYELSASNNYPGTWSKISGPGNATFVDPTNPDTDVKVTKYGKYVFRWTVDCSGGSLFDDVEINFIKFKVLEGERQGGPESTFVNPKNRSSMGTLNIEVMENPCNGNQIFIKVDELNAPIGYNLFSLQGNNILSGQFLNTEAMYCIELNPTLPSGTYLLKLGTKDEFVIKKIVVLN